MERFFSLKILRYNLNMSKFGSGYRRKSGNCNKPLRRFQDFWEVEEGSGTHASTSPNVNFRSSDHSEGRRSASRYGHQSRNIGTVFGKGLKNDKASCKAGSGFNRMFSGKCAFQPEPDPVPGSSNRDSNSHAPLRHPPGLKGKEIGLWYSSQKKNRDTQDAQEKREDKVVEVFVDSETQTFLEEVLNKTGASGYGNGEELLHSEEDTKKNEGSATFEEKMNNAKVTAKVQDVGLDRKLYNELLRKKNNSNYMRMATARENLPCFAVKDEIINLVEQNQVVVVSGGTGCGKSTQIVQYVLDHYILNMKGSVCNIICTQPRRISAITVAERVASERAESIGDSIGYQIRLEKMLSSRNKGCINFMTTGVLLSTLESEPILDEVSHLFLDEVHERNVESDLMMALLKYILPKRPDLKVILMSATVNESSFSSYFSGAPTIHISGFMYPVQELFLEDILQKINFNFELPKRQCKDHVFNDYVLPYVRDIDQRGLYSKSVITQLKNPNSEVLNISLMTLVVEYICMNEDDGAILVFLPGISEITAMQNMIINSPWYSHYRYRVIPMHSILPSIHQKEAFVIPPAGVRKIILATSILETSVTVDDVSYVVDSGRTKFSGYDIKGKIATLGPSWITLANAKQRRGRAGRTKPGKCYKLYSKVRQDLFDQYPTPESQTTSLEEVILKAKLLQLGHVAPFLLELMDPPSPEMIELSLRVLRNLNVLDSEERLTPLGFHLSKLPMHPRMGKMILMAALFSCIDPVFSIAACLSFKDPFTVPLGKEDDMYRVKEFFADGEKSDHFVYSEALRLWEEYDSMGCGPAFAHDHYLSIHTIRLLREMKKQFAKILHSMNFLSSPNVKDSINNVNSGNRALLKAIVCAGLYPNVAFHKKELKKSEQHLLKTVDHERVLFHVKSYLSKIPMFESPFFVYHLILKSSSIFIHDATMIHPMPLLFFGERLDIAKGENKYYLHVDDIIKFKSNKPTGLLVKSLRKHLDGILEKAISNPEEFKWHHEDGKTEILSAIVKLLSSEIMSRHEENSQHKIVQYTSRA